MEHTRPTEVKFQPWRRLLPENGSDSNVLDICTVSDRPWVRLQLAEEARANAMEPRQLRYPDFESYRRPDPFPQIYKAEKGRYESPEEEASQQLFMDTTWNEIMRKLVAVGGNTAGASLEG